MRNLMGDLFYPRWPILPRPILYCLPFKSFNFEPLSKVRVLMFFSIKESTAEVLY